jgi:predicted Zn-dependent protease
VWAAGRWRGRDYRALAGPVIVAVALTAFSAAAFPSYRHEDTNSTAALAEIYQERGDYGAARRVIDASLRRMPADARLLCAKSKLCLRTRDVAGAVDYAGRCVSANPYTPDGWYLLGLAREASGDAAGAEAAYREQLRYVAGHEGASRRLRR